MKHSFCDHLKIISKSKEKIRMKKLLIVLAACLTLSGCGGVSQSDYDAAVQERDALATQVAELQTANDSLTAENDTLSAENESLKAENQTLTAAASTAASTSSASSSSAAASADTSAADTAAASETNDTAAEYSYIGNRNSYKFHRPSCSYLPAEHNRVYYQTREEAVNDGMVPCKRCDP